MFFSIIITNYENSVNFTYPSFTSATLPDTCALSGSGDTDTSINLTNFQAVRGKKDSELLNAIKRLHKKRKKNAGKVNSKISFPDIYNNSRNLFPSSVDYTKRFTKIYRIFVILGTLPVHCFSAAVFISNETIYLTVTAHSVF